MAQNEHEDAIARAWALHREGRQNDAINAFETVTKRAPDNIDALYGLGLAQRAAGDKEGARATFQQCFALLTAALEGAPGTDRFEMLQRMVEQRIEEIAENSTAK